MADAQIGAAIRECRSVSEAKADIELNPISGTQITRNGAQSLLRIAINSVNPDRIT
jgi:hypothetical protein